MGAKFKMIGSSHLPRLKNKLRRQPATKTEGSSSSLSMRSSISDLFQNSGAKPSKSSEGSSSSLSTSFSISDSFRDSGVEYEGKQTRDDRLVLLKAFIPDEMGPGQEVKLLGPDGRKVGAVIPPRSQWSFQNCGGEPRPFFLIQSVVPAATFDRVPPAGVRLKGTFIDATESCRPVPAPKERSSASAGRRASFRDAFEMVCQCVVSEGVFDSFCPIHGTD